MPAQSTRGISSYFPAVKPKASGVFRIELYGTNACKTTSTRVSMYAYYSAIDEKWYTVLGKEVNKSGKSLLYWLRRD